MSVWGRGRKFSTLRKRMSFTKGGDDDVGAAREARDMKTRLRGRSRYSKSVETGSDLESEGRGSDLVSVPDSHADMSRATSTVSNNIVFMEMPSPKEVDQLLEKTLEDLAIPEGGKAKFHSKSIEEKWKVVQAHMNYNPRRKGGSSDVKSAAYWIKKLKQLSHRGRPRITPKESLNMVSVFRTAHKAFITDFLENKGLAAMNNVVTAISQRLRRDKNEAVVLQNLIECYRLLVNTDIGMNGVLISPKSVTAIAMSMDLVGNNTTITEKVLLLLSVMCWWDEEGRIKVMEAMRHIKKRFMEISTFQTIVYIFQHSSNVSFQASVATFITTVCNTPPDIEQRVGVRNYFFRLDIISIFQKVLTKAPENAFEEEGPWRAINTQYQVFVAMMRQDQEEIVNQLIAATDADDSHFDLSNLQDSWKILQKNAFKSDCHLELMNIVQALFLVPTVHDLAVPIFESITKFIYEAATVDDLQLASHEKIDFAKQPVMNFEELGKLLKRKIEYNARMEVFSEKEGTIKRLRKLVGVMQKRLMDVTSGQIPAEEAMDLQEDLIKNHLLNPNKRQNKRKQRRQQKRATKPLALATSGIQTGGFGAGDINVSFLAGLGLMDTAGEVEILKERETKMKAEIDKLQKQVLILSKGGKIDPAQLAAAGKTGAGKPNGAKKSVNLDSTGLEPAGIVPGKELVPPPPVPTIGMPGSLENAPLEWNTRGGAAPPKKVGGGGGPKKGGLEGLFAARAGAMKRPKNNKAEKYKAALEKLGLPDKKALKPACKMTQVFWKVIAPDALEGTIWPELSDQSIKYDQVALEEMFGKKETNDKKRGTKAAKPVADEVKLIDGKRRQNLAIALKKIKIDFSHIKSAIIEVDLEVISKDNVTVFIQTIPTLDELTLLNKYEKEGGDPAKLPFEERYLWEVSRIPNLLNRLECIKTFYRFAYDARRVHSVIVRMKKALKEVNNSAELRQILEVILAIGNYMNGASARGAAWGFKIDILNNIINVKASNNNGTLMHFIYALFEQNYPNLIEFSLPASAAVVDINFKEAIKEMNTLAKQVTALKQETKRKPFSKADKLKKRFNGFQIKATRDIEKLQQLLEAVRTDFHNLALKFAEKGPQVEPCTFFPKLVGFEQDLKRAGLQIVKMREAEARKKVQEEKKQERIAQKKLKILVEQAKDENGDINIGLIEAYKKSQQGKANQVVDRFLEKYNRDKSRLARSKNSRRSITRKKRGRYLD